MSAVLMVVRTNFFITYLYDQEILKNETHWPQRSMLKKLQLCNCFTQVPVRPETESSPPVSASQLQL